MFEHCLYFNTISLARLLEREWSTAFKPFNLTPSQAFMLRLIIEKPGLLQMNIAKQLVISRPTATRILDGLQKMKLIERRTTKEDGREYEIYPTKKAEAIKEDINNASAAVTKNLRRSLHNDVFNDAVAQLKMIRTNLE